MASADSAKHLYRQLVAVAERRRRGRLQFAVGKSSGGGPAVYFLAPDYDRPAGGTMVIYRHVDILNAAGIRAYALHERKGFRYSWFENETPVTDLQTATLRTTDLLVVSELDVDLLGRLSPGIRHVIFNQNSHLTWTRPADEVRRRYRASPDLAAVITVSAHNKAMLERSFSELDVRRIHLGIDPDVFYPVAGKHPRRITYMPRRGGEDARQVLQLLHGRGVLDGWEVLPLDGLTHEEVASELRSSRIFLAFTYQEGFGLPAAEAMACGNYVIGYHGFGGEEFFRPEFSAPVPVGDVLRFAEAVEAAVGHEIVDPHWCRDRGRAAADYILTEYSRTREAEEVTALYSSIMVRNRTDVALVP